MPDIRDAGGNLDPAQAADLCVLIDLEACWENMRKAPGGAPEVDANSRDLLGRQRAYEAFRAKLAAYNSRYAPAHVPELLLNTPPRLATWCRKMRDLYLQTEHDPRSHCPAHLLEKAYRWADRIGLRLNRELIDRKPPPASTRAAIEELEGLAQWCENVAAVAPHA
jgi:hypothetical protein